MPHLAHAGLAPSAGHRVHNGVHGYGAGLHGHYSGDYGGRDVYRRNGRHFVSNFHRHDHDGLWGYYAVGNGYGIVPPVVAPGYYPQYDSLNGWGGVTFDQVYYQNWNDPNRWALQRINNSVDCGSDFTYYPICDNTEPCESDIWYYPIRDNSPACCSAGEYHPLGN